MMKKINEMRELQKKKGKKGFSMIELIIVIAIMAILVALIGTQLIPYLEKSRESRDKTTLDTCKTAFESTVADYELNVSKGGKISELLKDKDQLATFEKYAGLSTTEKPFKSETAGKSSTVGSVEVTYTDGVLTKVTVGKLSVSTKDSSTTTSGGENSQSGN